MLRKKETYTVITPIPHYIPRQLALDILHAHSEVITLNPLVLSHKAIPAPRNAAADEYYSTWYEITQRVQVVPGMGKLGSSQISFNGCFHDMPWGLQTHIYAPMSVDLRNRYRIGGNQPGVEPPEQRELGMENLGIPATGLYLRQEAEIKANIAVIGHVKNEMKKASKDMVERIIKKAELLDSGALQAMFENGKLKTINPNDRSHIPGGQDVPRGVTPISPASSYVSPRLQHRSTFYSPDAVPVSPPQPSPNQYVQGYQAPPQVAVEPPKAQQAVVMELPGDYMYPGGAANIPSPQPSPGLQQYQGSSPAPSDPRWSQGHQTPDQLQNRMSVNSCPGGQSARQSYTAELSTHNEIRQ